MELDRLTFVEFAALVARHREHERAADQRAALVACTIAQVHGNDTTIEDFMPKTEFERAQERRAEMLNQIAAWQAKAAAQRGRETR